MTGTRNEDIVGQYQRDGYAIFRDVLDPDLVAEASQHVSWLQAQHPGLRPEQLGSPPLELDPFWLRLISDPRLVDIAERFLGPDVAVFASHYICKPAGDGQPVLWHQDGTGWPLEPMEALTLWVAVDASDRGNGCMRVIPATQGMSFLPLRTREDVPNVLGADIPIDGIDESQAVDFILSPGDVSVHHPRIVHSSEGNHSARRRCGLTIRYIPASTRITQAGWHPAFMLRGRPAPGINVYMAKPEFDPARHMEFAGCERW